MFLSAGIMKMGSSSRRLIIRIPAANQIPADRNRQGARIRGIITSTPTATATPTVTATPTPTPTVTAELTCMSTRGPKKRLCFEPIFYFWPNFFRAFNFCFPSESGHANFHLLFFFFICKFLIKI